MSQFFQILSYQAGLIIIITMIKLIITVIRIKIKPIELSFWFTHSIIITIIIMMMNWWSSQWSKSNLSSYQAGLPTRPGVSLSGNKPRIQRPALAPGDEDDNVPHCCTLFLKSAGYQQRNPNINIREIIWLGNQLPQHTSYLSRAHGRCPCKFFPLGVNFSRLHAKHWPFNYV